MLNRDEEIAEIRREIALIRDAFSVRLHKLEQRLISLENTTQESGNFTDSKTEPPTKLQFQAVATNVPTPAYKAQAKPVFLSKPHNKTSLGPKSKPLNLLNLFQDLLLPLLSPFINLLAPLVKLYQHYQHKGQGPIFLFMLIGIALLVGGFAYLAQLLVGELGAGSKTLMLFVVSIGVTMGGHVLAKKPSYNELGSATISLGLLLNFVTIYIAGSYYHLLADWLVLLAYFAVGISGFILSYRHSAQIVSVLALLGGGIIPLISQVDSTGTLYYLLGLSFLALGSLFQATTKSWYWLNILTVIIVSACLEYLLLFNNTAQIVGVFSQVFYCLYALVIWQFLRQKHSLSKELLVFITLSLFGSIALLAQSELMPHWLLTLIACVNCLAWLLILANSRYFNHLGKSVSAMLASVWLLVAIFSSLAADFWGLAVGLEGLFILYFALKENFPRLRIEAYGLITFAILHGIFAIGPYFPAPALLSFKGLLLLASFAVLLFVPRYFLAQHMMPKTDFLTSWEVALTQTLRRAESAWLVIAVISLAWVYLHQWSVLALIPLQLILLWKSHQNKCEFSESLVFMVTLGIASTVLVSALQNLSFSFSELPRFAQVSSVILLVELWALCEYYRRSQQAGTLAELAESLRLVAYLVLPIILLPSIAKHYPEYLSLALLVAASVAYMLARWIKHPLIRSESLALSLLATLYALIATLDSPSLFILPTLLSMAAGAFYAIYFLYLVKQRHRPLLDKKVASIALYFCSGLLAISTVHLSNVYLAGTLFSLYFFITYALRKQHPTLLRNTTTIQCLVYVCLPLSWISILIAAQANIMSASLWLACNICLILTQVFFHEKWPHQAFNLIRNPLKAYLFHHLLLATCTLVLLATWNLSLLIAPWLILQGSYLFFAPKQNHVIGKFALGFVFCGLLKLAFIDAANALLWQKVVLMIGIGIFMIAAAFVYQQRQSKALLTLD